MANGALVRVLIHTSVTKYLNSKAVDGSFVYNKRKIYKVPATDVEALKSTLMGLFEKRRARKFFIYVQEYAEDDPKSHEGLDLHKVTTKEVISKYGLQDNTIDFIGHALALHRDDSYSDEPAIDTIKKMKLYSDSLARFQGGSPYIYPLYGLGELPQVEFDADGKAYGVTSEGETAKCKKVVCHPSCLPDKVKKVGRVARAICIMSHPIPNTNDSHSVQIILPQKQLKLQVRHVCVLLLLYSQYETVFDIYDRYEPTNNHEHDNCFISTSYDATAHFESTVQDVISMYRKITGKEPDLTVDLGAASAATEDA
ncbi:hypothetical protein OPV22_023532 [Ensete ventricosum]|uniref:Guanosine nucleotide diphosphate dissociation inhibitor n=1 Tax=Ensete ventricosum TaxID=4639 RepID=A0AAV8QNT1_ENSVE|nr:hypothetical protein OPV22_023532 [Ensete ventricosum]